MLEHTAGGRDHGRGRSAHELGEWLEHALAEGQAAPVLAMRLLMEAETPEAARAALERAEAAGSVGAQQIADLLARNPSAWRMVKDVIGSVRHEPVRGDAIAHWSRLFDELVRVSPEASVALYSLGSPQLLSEATGEIVALLGEWGLLHPPPDVLDIGCGIGRLEAALAPYAASIIGIDISAAMVEEARARCGGLPNVRIERCSGIGLEGIATQSIDLIAVVDTLPYLMLSSEGLAARCLLDSARALRPGGSMVILNATYHGDADAELGDLAALAEMAGLHFQRADWRPLRSWDAPAFQLVRR